MGLTEDQNQARTHQILFDAFWALAAVLSFLGDTREFDQYIAYSTIRSNMQQILIRGGGPNEVVKTRQKRALLNQ